MSPQCLTASLESREEMQRIPRSSLLPTLAQAGLQLGSYQLAFADALCKHLHFSADPICICAFKPFLCSQLGGKKVILDHTVRCC